MPYTKEKVDKLLHRISNCYKLSDAGQDFFSSAFELTTESKELYELAVSGQGFVGLVDLATKKIHLIPTYNADDIGPRIDSQGGDFGGKHIISKASLGKAGHNAHLQAVFMQGLIDSRNEAGLLGLSIWKGGPGVRFLTQKPEKRGWVPNEYAIVQNERGLHVYYIDESLEACTELSLEDLPREITDLLEQIQTGDTHSAQNKIKSSNAIKVYHQTKFPDEQTRRIKHVRPKSTELNDGTSPRRGGKTGAITYDEMYIELVKENNTEKFSHLNEIARTLPFDILNKTFLLINEQLALTPVDSIRSAHVLNSDARQYITFEHEAKKQPVNSLFELAVYHEDEELANFLCKHYDINLFNSMTPIVGRLVDITLVKTTEDSESRTQNREIINASLRRLTLLIKIGLDPNKILNYMIKRIASGFSAKTEKLEYFMQLIDTLMNHGANLTEWFINARSIWTQDWILIMLLKKLRSTSDYESLVYHAIEQGDIPLIRLIGQIGAPLCCPAETHITPALIAAENGYIDILEALATAGVPLLNDNSQGYSLFDYPIAESSRAYLEKYLISTEVPFETLNLNNMDRSQCLLSREIANKLEKIMHTMIECDIILKSEQYDVDLKNLYLRLIELHQSDFQDLTSRYEDRKNIYNQKSYEVMQQSIRSGYYTPNTTFFVSKAVNTSATLKNAKDNPDADSPSKNKSGAT